MREMVFFLEERSARILLEGILPKILPEGTDCRFIVFEGKQDLEKQMVRKMRGYLNRDAVFIVLRDQDAADCREVKRRLAGKCGEAGRSDALVRIACRELESWYLADLNAVGLGFGLPNLHRQQDKQKYRCPDSLGSPKRELVALTSGRYQAVSGTRAIVGHLDVENTRSRSFAMLVSGIRKLAHG